MSIPGAGKHGQKWVAAAISLAFYNAKYVLKEQRVILLIKFSDPKHPKRNLLYSSYFDYMITESIHET